MLARNKNELEHTQASTKYQVDKPLRRPELSTYILTDWRNSASWPTLLAPWRKLRGYEWLWVEKTDRRTRKLLEIDQPLRFKVRSIIILSGLVAQISMVDGTSVRWGASFSFLERTWVGKFLSWDRELSILSLPWQDPALLKYQFHSKKDRTPLDL